MATLGRLSISEAFEMYRTDYIVFKGQSKKTEDGYMSARNDFIRFAGDIHLEDVTFEHIRNWKFTLEKRVGLLTLVGYLKYFRRVF